LEKLNYNLIEHVRKELPKLFVNYLSDASTGLHISFSAQSTLGTGRPQNLGPAAPASRPVSTPASYAERASSL
jgi:hypothetical protein